MSKENNFVEKITSREDDFGKWYTDIVKNAKLCEYSSAKGFISYLPNGYAIWENIQKILDKKFKETNVQNVYLPLLIPEELLQKEKDHIAGFAPEVAWVTQGGEENLEEKFCIRPTSETLFCDLFKKQIHSYRDLPLIWNQWNSVVRWEKTTRPFLRSREFLWQEGHTLHATFEEAEERTKLMWNIYRDFVENTLAIPLIAGRKTESEKFAGAVSTYTIESLMHDGKSLQSATSHFFGSGFPDAFDIKYLDKDNKYCSCYETSWGLSTRIIGALIMVHGDDSGLVLPPKIAPTKVRIIPIKNTEAVLTKAKDIENILRKLDISSDIDTTDKSAGYKFSEQEMLGIPIRIEIGPRDLENNEVIVVRRLDREKFNIKIDDLEKEIPLILENIQTLMYEKAKKHLEEHTFEATNMDEMKKIAKEKQGFIKAMWCGSLECEEKIKEETDGFGSRCIKEEEHIHDKCIYCNKEAKDLVYWAKSY